MPGIEDEIRTRNEEIAMLERRIEILRAQIDAFELALQYASPAVPPPTKRSAAHSYPAPSSSGSYRGGRQQGAISNRWKANLRELLRFGRPVTVEDIAGVVAANETRVIRPAEARRLFEGYAGLGYVIANADGSYSITDEAIEKFGLRAAEMETPPEGGESEEDGHVAELESRTVSQAYPGAQAPHPKRENVGSSPTVSSHTATKLLLGTAPLPVGSTNFQPSLWAKKGG